MRTFVILVFIFFSINIFSQHKNTTLLDPQRGIYNTLDEFLNNSPSIRDSFYVDSISKHEGVWEGKYLYMPKKILTNERYTKVWGFSDGTKCYKYFDTYFYEIIKEGENYFFYGYDKRRREGVISSFILFGIVGGFIHRDLESDRAKSKMMKYRIQIPGQDEFRDSIYTDFQKQESYLVVYRRGKKKDQNSIRIQINDTTRCTFLPNTFQKFTFNQDSVSVIYGVRKDKILKLDLEPGLTKYLKCTLKNNEEKLEEVYAELAEMEMHKPRRIQSKKNKKQL